MNERQNGQISKTGRTENRLQGVGEQGLYKRNFLPAGSRKNELSLRDSSLYQRFSVV